MKEQTILVIGRNLEAARMKLDLLRIQTSRIIIQQNVYNFLTSEGTRFIAVSATNGIRGFKPEFVFIDKQIPQEILTSLIFPLAQYQENYVYFDLDIDLEKQNKKIFQKVEEINMKSNLFVADSATVHFGEIHDSSKQPKTPKHLLKQMGIDRVIFNENATIVFLTTGEKGVAVRSPHDEFDPVIGVSVAYAMAEGTKGNKSKYKELITKLYKKQTKE